jgi:hypothetical protein
MAKMSYDYIMKVKPYTPTPTNIPYLQVPENRLELAYNWYSKDWPHPLNFPCFSHWINQCEGDGSDY